MKKTYISPAVECIALRAEHMMALSVVSDKADNSAVLSNSRIDSDWEDAEF